MNFVKKLNSAMIGGSDTLADLASPSSGPQHQDKYLAMMHLRKIFTDFLKSNVSSSEYEQRLTRMIPIFNKLTLSYTADEMREQFKEAPAFASNLTKLFVQEIRKRATHQNTEAAALSISNFLQSEDNAMNGENQKIGWALLSALNFLIKMNSHQIYDSVCHAALPSTIIKCLYLFYDLPPVDTGDTDSVEHRDRLYDVIVELMSNLLGNSSAGDELAKKDDLSLLFNGISSWCPEHNQRWRRATSQLLMILSSRCLSQTVINYVHSKSCVSLFVENLRKGKDLAAVEIAEMIVCLFCVMKDSSLKTRLLLDDLEESNGYDFLIDFILANDRDSRQEVQDALRNLLLMFNTVVTSGFVELKPQPLTSVLYVLPGFFLPHPSGQGCSVRNIQAFQVLETVFLKSEKSTICSTVLDVVSSIYSADAANYFILEPRCTLGQFGEIIGTKVQEVQAKYFEIIEYVVFHLNYVPSKELLAVCISLKTTPSFTCTTLCLNSFYKLLGYNTIFKDILREIGFIEVLVSWIQQFWTQNRHNIKPSSEEKTVYTLSLDMLSTLLRQNNSNAAVFRECGGSRIIFGLVHCEECRQNCLILIQQMLITPGGEEELASLCTLLHSTSHDEIGLKIQILRCLVNVLRESHRVRIAFRRAGGYLYVVSLLVNMEGVFDKGKNLDGAGVIADLEQLQLIFKVLTLSMRFEPANAKFFASEVRFNSLSEGVRLLGCFKSDETRLQNLPYSVEKFNKVCKEMTPHFGDMFQWRLEEKVPVPQDIPLSLALSCFMIRTLYDMALDNFEKPNYVIRRCLPSLTDTPQDGRSLQPPSNADNIIVHPGAVLCILEILPSMFSDDVETMLSLHVFTAEVLKSLVRSERNQQVMCEAGLPRVLFSIAASILILDDHPLLPQFHYTLERLSAHSMQPRELRDFLRLGEPLCCRSIMECDSRSPNEDHKSTIGKSVPLSRVKTLVSMMTPRDFRVSGASLNPAFVEFDMSVEGFGCVLLPSIAPQGSSADGQIQSSSSSVTMPAHLSAVLSPIAAVASSIDASLMASSQSNSSGGLGVGERVFPPLSGLTFASWFYVEKYSDLGADSHPLRLLTVVRCIGRGTIGSAGSKGHSPSDLAADAIEHACFQIQISPLDHALLIATHETDTPGADLDRDVNSSDTFVRLSIAELRQEQQWCHLGVVLTRSMLKNSTVTVYVNGKQHITQKIHYIAQNSSSVQSTSLNNQQTVAIKAVIGTAPGPFRKQSKLLWRLGPAYLVEEACSSQTLQQIYKLGANYVGSLQTPTLPNGDRLSALIAEEKLIFGLNARSVSQLTLARLRKVYNKADGKMVARTLGMSSHENATPIRILHNSAAHLPGASRSLGGVLIGYLGIRTFCPKPVAKLLESVGGSVSLVGLVAMATDTEGLYAAIKALLCAVRWNRNIAVEMDSCRGYQTLAMLLKQKSHLLHSHVLHLIFSLIGTLDASHETAAIPNVQAFEDLLCDLLAWHRASPDLQRLLYEHFYLLITESGDQRNNLTIIRQIGLLNRILQITAADPRLLWSTKEIIFNLIAAILQPVCDNASILRFGQFIASTLPTACPIDAEKKLPFDLRDLQSQLFANECKIDDIDQLILYQVYVRNRCLNILVNLLSHTTGTMNVQICEQVARVLGFDWIISLLSPRSHAATVWAALKILLILTGHGHLMQKFKEGSGNGGWLKEAESVVQNRAGVVLGFSVSARCGTVGSACDLNPEICTMPGFLALQHVLPHHATMAEPYLALLSQLVGQPARDLPHIHQFDLDGIWSLIFGLPPDHSVADAIGKVELCPEASLPLLSLIRRCLTLNVDTAWCKQYPLTLMLFLTFLYHNVLEFATYTTSEDFLSALTATIFKDTCAPESVEGSKVTSDHPALKYIYDLLRNIIVDSFAFAPVTKGDTIIDTILDLMPEGSSRTEQANFVTNLQRSVMDHLVASDVLLCGQSLSLPLTLSVSSNYSVLAANVFYFTTRVVDCVWNGLYNKDAQVVLDFILKLFNQIKRKSGGSVLADPLYFPLNRCILFVLSRFVDGLNGQMSLLESLHKVIAARAVIFGSANNDAEFFGCLSHMLFMLTDVSCQEIPINVDNSDKDPAVLEEEGRIREGALLIANSARRLWEEMFLSKKSVVEETVHLTLVPEINAARALAGEAANRCWRNFVDGETRGVVSKDAFQIHLQLQSKLQKVAGGLQRLTSRKATRCSSVVKNMTVSAQTLELWMKVHISLIRELVELTYTQYLQWHEHTEKWCLTEWKTMELELVRERGLWGPFFPSHLDKWQLDSTEGPCRMRKKLVPNSSFYITYPYRPKLDLPENKSMRCKVALSRDSKQYYEKMLLSRPETIDARIVDNTAFVSAFDDKPAPIQDVLEVDAKIIRKASRQHSIGTIDIGTTIDDENEENLTTSLLEDETKGGNVENENQVSATTTGGDTSTETSNVALVKTTTPRIVTQTPSPTLKGPDNQTLLRLLEEGEELQSMFRCARINGLETSEGLLLFGKEHYYVVDGFTLLKTKEIRDLDFLPEELHDPIVPYIANGPIRQTDGKRMCSKFGYEDIREVHKRRYLLQPIALEVFSVDGRNYLLAFPKRVRNKVHSKFLAVARNAVDAASQNISGQRSSVHLEQGAGLLGSLMGETSVTQRWARGEISNFQYLMHLNTLAGRSYNDLSQYPVFPWVLADYDSEELDLTDPNTFRDLSTPMGAQTPDRLEQFLKRFREWDDPSGETLPYMYGTHYSSAMIVVSYLVRMEPFTQQFLKLQGGHFDLADRMFHSIKEGWLSASKNNMADVKELIPEFFYLPDFLMNSNNFDLGSKQSGVLLGDVVLPPWAKGDPREFVRVHREALECDYVSSRLHEWIDLIFGHKQLGQQAVESNNLYHHLFYEGNVDFESIDDSLTRNATIGFINNFGQIPTQLFKKPHPQKRGRSFDSSLPTVGVTTERLFFNCLENLRPPLGPLKELRSSVGQMTQNDRGQLLAVEQNKVLVPPNFNKYFSWGYADNAVRMGVVETERSFCVHEMTDCGEITCATCPNNRTVVTGGTNTVVSVWEILLNTGRTVPVSLRLRKALYGHIEPVTCVFASSSYGIVVSGSKDSTCIVWDLSRLQFIRQLRPEHGPISAVCVNDSTGDIAASCGTYLFIWTINGTLMSSVNSAACPKMDGKQLILSIAFSTVNEWDPQHVIITGSNDGVIRMWSLEFVQHPDESESSQTAALEATDPISDSANYMVSGQKSQPAPAGILSTGSTAAGELVSMVDPHGMLSSMSVDAAEDNNNTNAEEQLKLDLDALRRRLAEQRLDDVDVGDDKIAVPLATQDDNAPRFRVGGGTPSDGGDSGTSTPAHYSVFKEADRASLANSTPPLTTSFESRFARLGSSTDSTAVMKKQGSTDSFVYVNKEGMAIVKTPPNKLRKGFVWRRQLVFRYKLTMHTSFERKDNVSPAAITSLAVSRDHKAIFVGDALGRVWTWSISETCVGGRADHWFQDPARSSCAQCHQKFSLTERRHHCRNCGQIFCAKCSRYESDIRHLKISKPVRVCQNCYIRLKVMETASGGGGS